MADDSWKDDPTLVRAWLLMVFPVGLFAVWTGRLFDQSKKWMITALVLGVLLLTGPLFDALLALILAPLAVVLLWKDERVKRPTVYKFAAGAGVILLLFLAAPGPRGSGFGSEGGCTYFRDSDFNVFARSCD